MNAEEKLSPKVRRLATNMFARGTGLSGPEIHSFFQRFDDNIPDYSWGGNIPSRWVIFENFLDQFPPHRQTEILRQLCALSPWEMKHGAPSAEDLAELRGLLQSTSMVRPEPLARVEEGQWDWVRRTWAKAQERVPTDPEGAITAARSFVETACRHILEDRDIVPSKTGDLIELYGQVAEALGLRAERGRSTPIDQIFRGMSSTVNGLAAMRNEYGDSHGKSPAQIGADRSTAQLAVSSAGLIVEYLIARHESTPRD